MTSIAIYSEALRNVIKEITEKYYKVEIKNDLGMTILKELIQNANDASAKTLDFGYHKGNLNSNNPLLRNPGLFFINDGEFSSRDLISIHTMWASGKSENPDQIGKFGLGLKSVFNWCETFFYFSSGISDSFKTPAIKKKYKDKDKYDVFNPWSPTPEEEELQQGLKTPEEIRPYPEWSNVESKDHDFITTELHNIIKNHNQWFCIWIPLRKIINEIKAPFKKSYPGDNINFPNVFEKKQLRYELLSILPFMSNLNTITYWNQGSKKYSINCNFNLPTIKKDDDEIILPQKSKVYLDNDFVYNFISYKYENYHQTNMLNSHSDFPTDEDKKPEETFNQGAISISLIKEKDVTGCIILDWCVFLPLSDRILEKECKGYTIHIKLHGWFFIDSGRTKVDFGEDETNLTIKQKWNRTIATQNTLPQLIPVIDKIINSGAENSVIDDIANTLEQSELYSQHWMKEGICVKDSLLNRVYGDKLKWEVCNSNIEYFTIPRFVTNSIDADLINKILERNVYVIEGSFYGISKYGAKDWTTEMYLQWLNISVESMLGNYELSKLWLSIISLGKNIIQGELVKYTKKALNEINFINSKEHKAFILELLSLIKSEFKVLLDLPKDFPQKYFLPLLNIDIVPILLNQDFYDEYKTEGYLSINDCDKILNNIIIEDDKRLAKLILSLLKAVRKEDRIELLKRNNHLKIFLIYNETYQESLVSWDYICKLMSNKSLFSFQNDIYREFSQTIKINRIGKLINYETEEVLGLELDGCTVDNALDFITTHKPDFQSIDNKVKLFSKIQNVVLDDAKIKSIRYLLHNQKANFDSLDPLFISSNDLWSKFLFFFLKTDKKEWTIINKELIRKFNRDTLDKLNVWAINQDIVEEYIRTKPLFESIDLSFLNNEERFEIISRFKNIELLKKIPLFENLTGQLVPITDNTFIFGGNEIVPSSIMENLTFIKFHQIIDNKNICRKISPNSILETIFDSDNANNHWDFILSQIAKVSNISDKLRKDIRLTKWVPLKNNKFCSLNEIVHLEGLENIISEINNRNIYGYEVLHDKINDNSILSKLNNLKLMNDELQNLLIIKNILLTSSINLFGNIASKFINKDFDIFLSIFDSLNPAFPISRVINKIKANCSGTIFYNEFIPSFFKGIPLKRTFLEIFNYLQNKYNNSDNNDRLDILNFYKLYLKLLKPTQYYPEVIKEIKLLNQNNEWCASKELCYGSAVSKKYLLNDTIAELLSDKIIKSCKISLRSNKKTSIDDLIVYFNNLADRTSSDLVGLFLSCFDNKGYTNLATEKYLTNNRTVPEIRILLNESWKDEADVENIWNIDKVIKESKYQILLERNFSQDRSVKSILDEELTITIFDSKLDNTLNIKTDNANEIVLKEIILTESNSSIAEAFRNTFSDYIHGLFKGILLKNLHDDPKKSLEYTTTRSFRKPSLQKGFNDLWDKFAQVDQNTIELTQRQIIEHLIPILQDLRVKSKFVDMLFEKDDERRRYEADGGKEELSRLKNNFITLSTDYFEKQVFTDSLFEAVKDKLKVYQYDSSSVLYELFQNADDAVSELVEMGLEPYKNEFVVNLDNDTLTIMHWGRKINQTQGGSLSSSTSQKRRYNDDVVKMLRIGYSRKDENQTGKYGLGFKSVYSICKSPKILSGRLAFEIAGAVYPRKLNQKDITRLQNKILHFQSGTIIEMDLFENSPNLIDNFKKYAFLQSCFSKEIKNIRVNQNLFSCRYDKIFNCNSIVKVNIDNENIGLLFKSGEGSILFKINSNGFSQFPEDIPSIWVTVPTKEKDHLGFIINSSFDIDVGRAQLTADNTNNYIICQRLGETFFNQLSLIYDKIFEEFNKLKKQLRLSINIDFYDFWKSFFDILTINQKYDTNSKAFNIAYQILWKDKNIGYHKFLLGKLALPNGLAEKYKRLLSLSDVKYTISGVVADDSNLLKKVLSFKINNKFDSILCSSISENIYSILPIKNEYRFPKLKLKWFILQILDNKNEVEYNIANQLGCFLSDEIYTEMKNDEKEDIKEYLKELKFKSITNKYTKSKEILILDQENREEEGKRGSFAQDEYILDQHYDSNGITFVVFCRGESGFFADVNKLADWALNASSKDKKISVLKYILNGELCNKVSDNLKTNYLLSTWLITLKQENVNSEFLYPFNPQEQIKILASLGFAKEYWDQNEHENDSSDNESNNIDWQKMLTHWKKSKDNIIRGYENKIYPSFFKREMLTDDYENQEVRKNWMILFILGMTHTFGFQNHNSYKKFIEILERKNLLSFISNYQIQEDKATEKWIEEYIDPFIEEEVNDEEFRIWMNSFSGIYKISKHLSIYIQRFSDGLKYKGRRLFEILKPKTDHEAYENAPPLNRTLNMGANFILRELVRFRQGDVENKEVFKECFVPQKTIREQCGLDSKQGNYSDSKIIYDFIVDKIGEENATFDFSFDIAINHYLKNYGG